MKHPTVPAHSDWAEQLLSQGYCIIPQAVPPATIAALDADLAPAFERTPFCHGAFYGGTTKRFGRLLARSRQVAGLVRHPLMLGLAEQVLLPWCDRVQLNVAQAIAVHPGAPQQLPHRDQDMWRGPVGTTEYLVNVMWPLTSFTAGNGATRIWPNSHGPASTERFDDRPSLAAEMEPGAALVFLGSTLHGAGANATNEIRRGIVVGYSLGWLKPYENPWLSYPPHIARGFAPELAALVGYAQHRPNLGNYEGQCPSILLGDDVPEALAAVDALRPDQQAMIDAYQATLAR